MDYWNLYKEKQKRERTVGIRVLTNNIVIQVYCIA